MLGGPPPGSVMGTPGVYNYSPSIIQSGNLQQFWWCGQGSNPNLPSQVTDTIQYGTLNTVTHEVEGAYIVLGETPHSWDSMYVCNPKVVEGIFVNPLGDGQTYTYAMYYVGTSAVVNNIGVAFSKDGRNWKKYPEPVINATTHTNYGVGQPCPYNSDHKSAITLFWEDANSDPPNPHVEATSTDGIHFTVVGTLTRNGLGAEQGWGDIAYDPVQRYWYAVFNNPLRPPSTTGGFVERGQPGITLYRIPGSSLLTGDQPWQQLGTFDTNLTGNEANFIAGLLRDPYGNLNVGPYPTIQIYPSISDPAPHWDASPRDAGESADVGQWDIGVVQWDPHSSTVPLKLYENGRTHEVTTGWVDPNGSFAPESTLGHLYQRPEQEAKLALYGCKDGKTDYFVSRDSACEGRLTLGLEGYGYAQPPAGISVVPLYRCYTGRNHFVSQNPGCNGARNEELLGFALP